MIQCITRTPLFVPSFANFKLLLLQHASHQTSVVFTRAEKVSFGSSLQKFRAWFWCHQYDPAGCYFLYFLSDILLQVKFGTTCSTLCCQSEWSALLKLSYCFECCHVVFY